MVFGFILIYAVRSSTLPLSLSHPLLTELDGLPQLQQSIAPGNDTATSRGHHDSVTPLSQQSVTPCWTASATLSENPPVDTVNKARSCGKE